MGVFIGIWWEKWWEEWWDDSGKMMRPRWYDSCVPQNIVIYLALVHLRWPCGAVHHFRTYPYHGNIIEMWWEALWENDGMTMGTWWDEDEKIVEKAGNFLWDDLWDDHGETMGILQGWKYYGGIIAMTLQIKIGIIWWEYWWKLIPFPVLKRTWKTAWQGHSGSADMAHFHFAPRFLP